MLYDADALNSGCIFEYAFDILHNQMGKGLQGMMAGDFATAKLDAALIVPTLTNGAFACELYLKAMLPEGTLGHDLEILFNKLEEEIQKKISRLTIEKMGNPGYHEEDFQKDLHTSRNVFLEWRYFHENTGQKGPILFISNFMKALLEVGKEERDKQ